MKLISYLAIACVVGFNSSVGSLVIAGGCRNHLNKSAEETCSDLDKDCNNEDSRDLSNSNNIQ